MNTDRLTRAFVFASAVVAVGLQTMLGARAWRPLEIVVPATFLVTWILSLFAPRIIWAVVLGAASVSPILILTTTGGFEPAHFAIGTAAVLGLVAGRAGLSGWSLPRGWRLSLGAWALAIAAVWPVVAWREVDFSRALLDSYHIGVTGIGIAPPIQVLWVAHIAALHLSGLLWIDALFCRWPTGDRTAFEREVAWPLAAGAITAALFSVYQMFGHLAVLSTGTFAFEGRASGGMLDANASGMIAAMWAPALVVLTWERRWPIRMIGAAAAMILVAGAWASGSRSALGALAIGGAGLAYGLLRDRPRRAVLGLAGIAVVAVFAVVALRTSGVRPAAVGPIPRFLAMLPASRADAIRDVASELWNRNGYGEMATRMVREWPLTGIGVGTFNAVVVDYGLMYLGTLPPDNAQNWFRHQLAEFGVLGSVGWIVWVVLCLRLIVRRGVDVPTRVPRAAITGSLVGLGVASLAGMPTQNDVVLLMFWTFVFWLSAIVGAGPAERPRQPVAGSVWLVPIALTVVFVASTAWVSVTGLRIPQRAARADWDFDYGLAPAEHLPDGTSFRWSGSHAVWVANYDGPLVRLTYWVSHPDVRDRPVHVEIRAGASRVVDIWLRDTAQHTVYLRLPGWVALRGQGWHPGVARLMLEARVDRTWRPSETGGGDTRDLGVALSAQAVCCLPAGAIALDTAVRSP